MTKELGKIASASFGSGGYDDAMFGASFNLRGDGWGVGDFWGTWTHEPDQYSKWTAEDQIMHQGEMVSKVKKIMQDAKVKSFDKLVGIPVEVTFNQGKLHSWRVLTEVL